MPEVHSVQVQIERPKGRFEGRVVEGRYIVEDGVLSLTNHDGIPVRDAEGKAYTHKLEPGDNAKQIAGLLTKKFRRVRRGGSSEAPRAFSGPLTYPKLKY